MKKQNQEAEEAKKGMEKEEKAAQEANSSKGAGTKAEKKEDKKEEKEKEKKNKKEEKKEHDAKLAKLEEENAELKEKLQAEKNDYVRLMAEFENFRRRTAQEKLDIVSSAAADTLKGLLPVLDDCERAMEILEKSSDSAAKEGTGLIYNKLMGYLHTKGLEKIEAKGAKFDTDFHEAVAQLPVPEEDKKGLVYDVIETGYLLNGKVLRYAKVVVGV